MSTSQLESVEGGVTWEVWMITALHGTPFQSYSGCHLPYGIQAAS